MLRPQVFALQEGEVQIGLICSEKQAIDATLQNLAAEDSRFCPVSDRYWNARGGSSSDGGAFLFTVKDAGKGDGSKTLVCTNKFGETVRTSSNQTHYRPAAVTTLPAAEYKGAQVLRDLGSMSTLDIKENCVKNMPIWDYAALERMCGTLCTYAQGDDESKARAIEVLTHLNDHYFDTGGKKRSSVLALVRGALAGIFAATPRLDHHAVSRYRLIDWTSRASLRPPRPGEGILVLNARNFPPEGDDCDARLICAAFELGWKQFICYGYRGQRFLGCGLGKSSDGVRIDVYDSSGDYLASGIDGMEIHVHGNAQDQLGQIMKRGKLVVYGDVGQTFMYGAKGGEVYVMGNAAGRPLINAVGYPRVVINGTCLDYLAESFMAGDPLNGGGFVILNGVHFDNTGKVVGLKNPYPGSNLFSLASGGAIYVRDPQRKVVEEQLNGGTIVDISTADWRLIRPYLEENERLFGISVTADLLTVGRTLKKPQEVYRKVMPVPVEALTEVEDD
jgi:glutamate synthase domain-containing protein 3